MKKVCGEEPEITILKKDFNVLCVTQRHSKEQEERMQKANIIRTIKWHQPITGQAVLEVIGVQMGEVQVPAEIRITFNEMSCEFLYFRTGLGGCTHVIAVKALMQSRYYDVWELYTDELTKKGEDQNFNPNTDVQSSQSTHSYGKDGGKIWGGPDPGYANGDLPLFTITAVS
tara:strand:+ start:1798 stop:2313 length:516 start_codon:yes stop_codon:yes gene_type:complete